MTEGNRPKVHVSRKSLSSGQLQAFMNEVSDYLSPKAVPVQSSFDNSSL